MVEINLNRNDTKRKFTRCFRAITIAGVSVKILRVYRLPIQADRKRGAEKSFFLKSLLFSAPLFLSAWALMAAPYASQKRDGHPNRRAGKSDRLLDLWAPLSEDADLDRYARISLCVAVGLPGG
ncbi:MAG: hypothetical protein ACREBD_24195 [Blastocatellia bacterium]